MRTFNDYLREKFKTKVHKISLNAGFSCPSRDGSLSAEGCVFCNESGFSRFAGTAFTLDEQMRQGMALARKRFKAEKFIAYFQNGSNTYASPEKLKEAYDTIKRFENIVGLSVSTRPDCIDGKKLDVIESYADNYEVWIEYGVQTVHDRSLGTINRFHTFGDSLKAIQLTAKRRIKIGAHVILGLPGESHGDMMETAQVLSELPVSGVKLHVLHVLRDTRLEALFNRGSIRLLEAGEYIDLASDFIRQLNPECVILRLVSDANPAVLIAPKWINEKQKVIKEIENKTSLCIRQL